MKRSLFPILALCVFAGHQLQAQPQQPFIITVSGGLFFPAHAHFKETYQSNSDLVYGFGIGLPVNLRLIITADMSFFKSEALIEHVADSVTRFEEKFIHVGILSKQPLAPSLFVRLSGGFNYITVKQTVVGPQSGEQSIESEKKLGYFAGVGIEHLFEGGRTSLFADAVYDYRRIHDVNFEGDYGGTRFIMGVNFILF